MQAHNPARFATFEESADGRGFFIPTGEYFAFDEHGGWYDEANNYYDKNGAPAQPPAKPQGKNRGFNTQVYENQRPYRNDYHGSKPYRSERPYNNERKPYGGRNQRRRHDDFDDDPVLAEFGGDDYDDDRFSKPNREEEEKLERAYRLESRRCSPRKARGAGHLLDRAHQQRRDQPPRRPQQPGEGGLLSQRLRTAARQQGLLGREGRGEEAQQQRPEDV